MNGWEDFKREMVTYNPWWVAMWVAVSAYLLVSLFLLPFEVWSLHALLGFGVPELVGISVKRDPFPPLTYVVRRYVPRWLTFTLVYGFFGAAGANWFGFRHPVRMGLLFALLGWASNHFTVTYDRPEE